MAGRDGRSYGPWILQSPKDVAVLDAEGEDFEHLIWHCERFQEVRNQFWTRLPQPGHPQ